MASSRFHTKTYNDGESIVITENMGFSQLTVTVLSGTCTVVGDYPNGPTASGDILLTAGRTITLSSRGPGSPLAGITVETSNPGSVGIVLQP